MRRSRSAYAVVFMGLASLILITHLTRPSTFQDAYNSAKFNKPSFSLPAWMSSDPSKYGIPDNYEYLKTGSHQNDIESTYSEDELKNDMSFDPSNQPGPDVDVPSVESTPTLTTTEAAAADQIFSPATQLPESSAEAKAESSGSAFETTKYKFQEDLDLPLPSVNFTSFAEMHPHNYNPDNPQPYAYAAFMNTHNPSIKDPYFMALQNLIWRVLWSPRAKTTHYPFIAFVAEYVTEEQRAILAGAGAIVRELPPLEWDPPVSDLGPDHHIFARFKDMFSKLHMWNHTEFSRILFLDADAFPVSNIDDMFDASPLQECKPALLEADDYLNPSSSSSTSVSPGPGGSTGASACEPYVFAGVPQGIVTAGVIPEINVGAIVLSPSVNMYARLLQNYRKYSRYKTHMADQGFLSWQFRDDGAFPATLLDRKYDGFFPQPDEKGKLKVVHEKLWATFAMGWTKDEWESGWKEMVQWYDSDKFRLEREKDERKRTKTEDLEAAAAAAADKTNAKTNAKTNGKESKVGSLPLPPAGAMGPGS